MGMTFSYDNRLGLLASNFYIEVRSESYSVQNHIIKKQSFKLTKYFMPPLVKAAS